MRPAATRPGTAFSSAQPPSAQLTHTQPSPLLHASRCPCPPACLPALRTPLVADSRFACDYYRPLDPGHETDARILWGGRIDCMGIPAAKLRGVLQEDMAAVYPQLRSAGAGGKGVEVEVAWSGVMGYAAHKMPLIGRVTAALDDDGSSSTIASGGAGRQRRGAPPGIWYCTGFGGHGVCPTTVAGELIARAIVDGDDTYALFAPFGLRWAGGPLLGAAAAQAFYWAYEARDWANGLRMNRAGGK